MNDWVVCSDFDGTICLPDSSEYLLSRFAPPEWKDLDDAVWSGRMTEREAFRRQIALLRVNWHDACAALAEGVRIREGFPEFIRWCRSRNLPFVILSSGLRPLIDEMLNRSGVANVLIESHDVLIDEDRWDLILHRGRRLAEHCSHCKCAHLADHHAAGRRVIYIGDGFTDLCPARFADVLFATGRLSESCPDLGMSCYPFTTFFDIQQILEKILPTTQELPL